MKNAFVIILTLIGFITFGQEKTLDRIDMEVKLIESDSTLKKTEFDWVEVSGIATDGGWVIDVWRNENQIIKIAEEIGLSYGRVTTTVYLQNEIPIKIVEVEENFGYKNDELNYEELNEVYQEIIYVFDWKNDSSEIKRFGKRNMRDQSCSMYELAESVIDRAKKLIAK